MHLRACGECKLPRAQRGCLGVWHSLRPLRVSGCCWDPLRYVPESSCSCFVPRVFLALVEEAEDRGGVVAQGGGKVRVQALLCCWPVLHSGLWGGLGSAGVALVWQGSHWLPRTGDLEKLGLL